MMKSIDPNKQTERENYKILTGTILPRPIAFVTSISEEGIVNAAPFSYFNIVSSNPPLISIAFQRKGGAMKDTAKNILNEKSFVVHTVEMVNVDEVNKTAASLDSNFSELDLTSLTKIKSNLVSVPGIKEAKVRMECVLEKHITFGLNEEITVDLIIGKVVQFHIDETILEDGRIDIDKLNPVSRLAGHSYSNIGKTFIIKRPK